MTTTRNLRLFQTLLCVFSWQCCANLAAIPDDVTGAANRMDGIGTLANTGGSVATDDMKAAVDQNGNGDGVFNVKNYGAKANGKTDDAQAFMTTWIAACRNTSGPATFLIPEGTFLVGPLVFAGPCQSRPITVEIQGTVKATTDITQYSTTEWISIEDIIGFILTGSGVFDGQGPAAWPYNDCKTNNKCQALPNSIKFSKVNHSIVDGLTSINSKGFHTTVFRCYNFTATNMNIMAPGNSPNTDGMHLSTSTLISISNSVIGTGDDCVSIGHSCEKVTVTNITCGPGHGISVGSLGKYKTERSVSDILVQNCTLFNTTNGVRIKTWAGMVTGSATRITFDNIVMDKVKNPIIIDQTYGTKKNKASKWKISDIHFKNIRGTSTTNVAVLLECSELFPCEGVELRDINLSYGGASLRNTTTVSSCLNAKITTSGVQNPPACAV